VSEEEFLRYFRSGKGQLWERQSLCKSRVVFGGHEQAMKAMKIVREAILVEPWEDSMASEVHKMRLAMQKGATKQNLKRGVGGTVDIEFAIQLLQLKHLADDPSLLVPGTLEATERLISAGILSNEQGQTLMEGYQLLRSVEARLRLMNMTARHDLPTDQAQLTKLAFLLNYAGPDELVSAISSCRKTVREQFEAILGGAK
jgi:glutamate-ammonia-ligase adenylyltransferase